MGVSFKLLRYTAPMFALALTTLLAAAPAPAPNPFAPKNRPYDAQHYKLELRLLEGGAFKNTLTATIKPTRSMTEVEFDAYDLTVESAKVDGEAATFKLKADPGTRTGTLTITAKKALAAGKDSKIEVVYSGKAGTDGWGLTSSIEDEPGALPVYSTHFEPTSAQRFFPCNDTPSDKATSEVLAVVDQKYRVISNGKKDLDEKFTEDGKNLRRVHWLQDKPHSTYLVAVAIGVFEEVTVTDDIPSTLWVPPGSKDRAFVAADALKGLYNFQSGVTGVRYPWAKLDVVAIPHTPFSGMENTSAIFERSTLVVVENKNDQLARSNIVGLLAHEMAHQWFGDLVTCATWDDVWLNESFATWLGAQTLDDYNGSDHDEVEIRVATSLIDSYFRLETGPRAHALVSKQGNPGDAFDAVTYQKGAQVLRMLELWVGKADFKKSIKAYLEKHALAAATSDDFFKAVFETTKKEKELKPFKDAWLNKRGYPILYTDTSYGGGKLTVTIRQQPSTSAEKGPFVFKLPIVVHRATEPAYTQEQTILVDKPEVKVTFEVPAAPQWINWNKNFGALAKINASTISEDALVDAARSDPDPVWRLLSALTLMGELGAKKPQAETLPTDAAMNAVLDVISKDPSPYVREAVLLKLAQTRFKQLPKSFAAPIAELAKKPDGLNDDAVGYIRVRRAAMEALGRVDSPDGQKYLIDEIAKRELDINYLGAVALGVARIGTPNALSSLRSAIVTQKGRGLPYLRRTIEALGAVSSVDAVSAIRDAVKQYKTNTELLRSIFERLVDNPEVLDSADYAALVKDVVLDETMSEGMRGRVLGTLDEVKYEAARLALTEIAEKSTSDRLKGNARQVLAANFPAPPTAPVEKKKK
jgi:aminopeptidase N